MESLNFSSNACVGSSAPRYLVLCRIEIAGKNNHFSMSIKFGKCCTNIVHSGRERVDEKGKLCRPMLLVYYLLSLVEKKIERKQSTETINKLTRTSNTKLKSFSLVRKPGFVAICVCVRFGEYSDRVFRCNGSITTSNWLLDISRALMPAHFLCWLLNGIEALLLLPPTRQLKQQNTRAVAVIDFRKKWAMILISIDEHTPKYVWMTGKELQK